MRCGQVEDIGLAVSRVAKAISGERSTVCPKSGRR